MFRLSCDFRWGFFFLSFGDVGWVKRCCSVFPHFTFILFLLNDLSLGPFLSSSLTLFYFFGCLFLEYFFIFSTCHSTILKLLCLVHLNLNLKKAWGMLLK